MRKLLFGFLVVMNLQAQVIYQDIDCHQGMINLTIADTSNTPGIYHLYYFDSDWVLVQGAYVEFQPDTFDITFSGIGGEMHAYDSMQVEFNDTILTAFSLGCGGVSIKPVEPEDKILRVEYFSLSGQPITDTKGLYIELKTFSNRQAWRKIYKN